MGFWKSQSGGMIDGSAENSHLVQFTTIPDGTTATAAIKSLIDTEYNGARFYQVTYKLIDGDFKEREVRQKIKCFESDSKKRDRGVNMLLRLFNICGVMPPQEAPTNNDLMVFINKIVGVKIREWHDDGKEGNYVAEVHPVNNEFTVATGQKLPPQDSLDSAFRRNSRVDKDVPF